MAEMCGKDKLMMIRFLARQQTCHTNVAAPTRVYHSKVISTLVLQMEMQLHTKIFLIEIVGTKEWFSNFDKLIIVISGLFFYKNIFSKYFHLHLTSFRVIGRHFR